MLGGRERPLLEPLLLDEPYGHELAQGITPLSCDAAVSGVPLPRLTEPMDARNRPNLVRDLLASVEEA